MKIIIIIIILSVKTTATADSAVAGMQYALFWFYKTRNILDFRLGLWQHSCTQRIAVADNIPRVKCSGSI